MITSRPRDSADFANSKSRSGVRWAETIFVSNGTPNCSSVSAAAFIVAQSDLLPMITATSGFSAIRLFHQLGTDDRFEFVPGVDGAPPIYDAAVFADHNVFRITADHERREDRFGVRDHLVIERVSGRVFSDRPLRVGRHSDELDIRFAGECRRELVELWCLVNAGRATD